MWRFSKEPVSSYKFWRTNGMKREIVFLNQCPLKVMKTCWLTPKIVQLWMRKKETISCSLVLIPQIQKQPMVVKAALKQITVAFSTLT